MPHSVAERKGLNMKKLISTILMAALLLSLVCNAFAESNLSQNTENGNEWTVWSEWSTTEVVASDTREVETRQTKAAIQYKMVHYGTQRDTEPYYRIFRDFSVASMMDKYHARASYGEKHLTRTVTADQMRAATEYPQYSPPNGSFVQIVYNGELYEGYQQGNTTAYNFGDDNKVWFIEETEYAYVTEYRYRDLKKSHGGDNTDLTAFGTCGKNAVWELDSEGTLAIAGSGKMDNFEEASEMNQAPWGKYSTSIIKVEILPGITNIGGRAFCNCCNLKSVRIPSSITGIGYKAFEGTAVETLYIDNLESYLHIDIKSFILQYNEKGTNKVYINGKIAKNVVIPDSISKIPHYAFFSWDCMKSVKIPSSVTHIGEQAFCDLYNFDTLYLDDLESFLRIEYNEWDKFSEFRFSSRKGITVYINDKLAEELIIPDTISVIPHYAFNNWQSVKRVTIPNGVTTIERAAFGNCDNLEEVSIPRTLKVIYPNNFDDCAKLKKLYIEDLESYLQIEFDVNIYFFGSEATQAEVYINGKKCENLVIPDTVSIIPGEAFVGWTCLKSVTIPDSVSKISSWAFGGCSNIKEVNYEGSKEQWEEITGGEEIFDKAVRINCNYR